MVCAPWLVQTIKCRFPKELDIANVEFDEGWKWSDYGFQFDYMGSAEFEFGAIPASFKELVSLGISEVKINCNFKSKYTHEPLHYVHPVKDKTFTAIELQTKLFQPLWNPEGCRLKEFIRFREYNREYKSLFGESENKEDAWYDLENHVFFSFRKDACDLFYKAMQKFYLK